MDTHFRVTLFLFAQCLIIMVHNQSTNLFLPCVWLLMTSKAENLYC
ncbi:hypothetical protein MXB_4785, partial [Myxobolus squamalis]